MKKLLSILALALCFVACQNEGVENASNGGLANVVLTVDAPELGATRADADANAGRNSAFGAIDFFNDADWANYDLRYTLEVYDANDDGTGEPIYRERLVNYLDKYAPTTFDLRLVPNREYKFVVFADFVEQGSDKDLNYNTANLKNITRMGNVSPMEEAQDAYFIQKSILVEGELKEKFVLTRPFGKIRVVATDINEVNLDSTPSRIAIKFYNHPTFTSLNALTGKAETETQEVTYNYTIEKGKPYTAGYDAMSSNQTLFADYIFSQTGNDGAQEVNFTMSIFDQNDRVIREHDFNTQIPLERNYLTTIIGNLLTTETEFEIFIDDNFEGEYLYNPEAKQLDAPAVVTDVDGNKVTLTWDAVANADFYTVEYNEVSKEITETSLELVLDYETEYTFTVQARTNNTMEYKSSEVTTVTATTDIEVIQLEKPAVSVEVKEFNNVVLTWASVANADYYTVTYGNVTEKVTETTATFVLDYATTYTFAVQALSNDAARYPASEVATIEATTEAEPVVVAEYIYMKPNSNWVTDNARFAVYTWIDGGDTKWYDMVDSDNDGIYEVEKSKLYSKIIFCRMNPTSATNDWNNKWNQTNDLTLPTNGDNLYTIADGSWDNGNGTWRVYKVTATLTFDNKAKRTTFSTTQQVWEENGIKLTNDKAASTNAVADYVKPARFYQGSSITVSAPSKIETIVFDCNSTSHATALKNSIGSTATVTVSSDKVTVTLDGTADNFVVAKLTAQVRMDAITVTYIK
jgi:hypothetical protein